MTKFTPEKMFDLNLENLPIGAQVKTEHGFIWTHVGPDSWKDETSQLTWLPDEPEKYTHYQALRLQNEFKRLPTKEEFEEAKEHEIRDIIKLMRARYRWSASVHPNGSDYACVFCSNSGAGFYGNRDDYYGSVRMVART